MMDVVFLTTSLERGGAETQLVRIALHLKRRGWSVGIATMMPSTAFVEEVAAAGIPLVACGSGKSRFPFGMAITLIRQLRAWRPRALVTFNFPADAVGRLCGRLAGCRHILATLRTSRVKNGLRKAFYRRTEFLVRTTLSNSQAAADSLMGQGLLSPHKVVTIPNGMIAADYPHPAPRAEVRAELGVPEGAFLWMAVGNLRPAKDYPTLLAAVARLAEGAVRPFEVVVVGGGELHESLESQARSLGLAGRVRFLGARADVSRLLKAADAFVLSSAWEGMPNTVMEAMATGLAVVATDVGGVRELVVPGATGHIVPAGDPVALAGALGEMMQQDPGRTAALGQAGRTRILEHFDIERVVDRWEAELRRHGAPGLGPRTPA